MFRTIAWATDGSAEADLALEVAERLAVEGGGRLVALHYDQVYPGGRVKGQSVRAGEEEIAAQIAGQVEELVARGVNVRLVLRKGVALDTARVLSETAAEEGADVIVIGSSGRGAVAGALLGSISHDLIHHAACPVLVVPSRSRTSAV